ncbi:CheY-like chemotaxis protein [Bradyrhizobium ottawaense]|uniref:response regulator n=1 Tax=Bradyrhizobium ottawaense TaxID=931866 RepID=UPI001BA62EBD|nr:response regulator [Bradyrhizobium diazoefficiens]MBR0925174.1 response regulator [Bradyrhizobium diazoefficiens]
MLTMKPVILIVEDEFLLRMDSVEILDDAGFEVIPAVNADEAVAILSAHTNVHLVFTDIQMPGSMDGLKLASFVRNRWPPIKIVATSGHVRAAAEDLPAGSVFLPKPYHQADLIATMRDLTANV